MTKEQVAEYFMNGIDCGQIVAQEFERETGCSRAELRRITATYAAGMMRGETCGAVLAAYNVIGLVCGHSEEGDETQKGKMLTKMLRYNELFAEKFPQGLMCKELLGADISTPEGGKAINEQNLFMTFCPEVILCSIDIVKQILAEDE